ncbi:unnamed protein product, partial [Mesorhabditis belari]|uniref:RRM domain-containing protein n=1 Tax=Mesorhabditis belari TaxID=2138241 RepID=A0AAF3EEE8_9BILA
MMINEEIEDLQMVTQIDNGCRIFVAGVPKFLLQQEVEESLKLQMGGIVDFELIMLTDTSSKGFGFVQFENRGAAVHALDAINRGLVRVGDVYINGSWAKPEHFVPTEVMEKVDGIFISNLATKTDRNALEKFFGGKNMIYRVVKNNNCAFIHFRDKDEARKAVLKYNKAMLDGSKIVVKLAKPPPHEKKINLMQLFGTNPYTNLFVDPLAMTLPYLSLPYSTMNLYQRMAITPANPYGQTSQAPGLLGPIPPFTPLLAQNPLMPQTPQQNPFFAQLPQNGTRALPLCLPPSSTLLSKAVNVQYQMMMLASQKGLTFPVMHCIPVGPDENPGFVASAIFPGAAPIFGAKCLSEEAARESAAEAVIIQLS